MGLGYLDVFLGPLAQSEAPLGRKRPAAGCGYSGHQGTFGHLHALRDHRPRRHDRLATNAGPIQNSRVHADETFVFDHASMNDRTVTNRDVLAHFEGEGVGQVSDDAVLQIRALSDRDEIDIAPQNRALPNAGAVTKPDVADHSRRRGNENTLPQGGFLVQVVRKPLR